MAEKMTKAQARYLSELPEAPNGGRRAITPPHKAMYRKLESKGLIERTNPCAPIARYVITPAGRRALDEASHDR